MRTGDGFMCVYSIIDRKTFDEVKEFREQILRVKDVEQIPMCIVGNKCDLESERVIPKEEGSAMAKNFGSAFFETSAKLRKNVDESFYELVREVRKAQPVPSEDGNNGKPPKKDKKTNGKGGSCLIL